MSDLLRTKLFIPRRRPASVERTRLTDQLKLGMDRTLTLITAPAGFGKTTLLGEWIPYSERCVTWVSLDKGDNDPVRFWAYFIAALQTLSADIGKKALALLRSPHPPPIEAILTLLLNEITDFPDGFAQVLDDYQVIHSQAIHTATLFFLEHMPPHMHLVIAGRTDPPLPLGRLRARNQVNEIGAADLRFTSEETALFLNQTMGLGLSAESVASLETFTEGWIAGLQLAGLALQGQDPQPDASRVSKFIQAYSGRRGHIASYLVEEVISQLPKGTMDFLLQTSILDSLSGPLCDYVLSGSSILHSLRSQAILEQLVHANVFIVPLDEDGKWFRYHHLFAEVLRARLEESQPGTLRELHLRASEWYEAAGSIPEAVRHALEAGEWECAARLMEQNTIGDEFSFPREREYLTLARLFIRRGRDRPENEDALKALHLLDRLGAAAQADGRRGSLIEILGLQAMTFQVMGDHGEALKSIEQALTLAGLEGYMRIFLDEGEPMRSLIADVRTSLAERSPVARWPIEKQPDGSIALLSYADQLLASFPGATPTAVPVSRSAGEVRVIPVIENPSESLSDRELRVLHLIATGASNAEIAETLTISVSTVKRHTGNLYGKLGVSSRTQAMARAQQLGLLP